METDKLIEKHALANAVKHKGKANPGAVIGGVLGEKVSLKKDIQKIQKKIQEIVTRVNSMDLEEQEKQLLAVWPDFYDEKPEQERGLPELPNAKIGKVITRLPPEPNGHMHIGHAISFFFNEYYAKKYKGKLLLRFEDTNPGKEKKEFYDSIVEDIDWLGIIYIERKNDSDFIELFYEKAEQLINKNSAYMCSCPVEIARKNRYDGKECECRNQKLADNMKLWKKMLKDMKPGKAVLRLKADMQAKNSVMRDPTLFRIVTESHPLQKKKYRVWPLYDFANSIADAESGITHVLRSNEFVQRDELQNKLRELLGYKNPEIISYSRIKTSGAPTSKREIKPLIDSGEVNGWDDPRLATIKGLKKRGILAETLRQLALEVRMTKGETTIDYKTIFGINRKLLDKRADRYFFVPNPVKLTVKNAPGKTASLKMHPDDSKRGVRKIKTKGIVFISADDEKNLKKGEVLRLKDLYNIKYLGNGKAEFDSEKVKQDTRKIQWVTEDNIQVNIIVPGEIGKQGLTEISGLAEASVSKIKIEKIVQFERFGFCKKDSQNKFIRAHG